MDEIGEGCLGRLNIQTEDAPNEFPQRHLAELLLKLFLRSCNVLGEKDLLQCLQLGCGDGLVAGQLVDGEVMAVFALR